MKKRIINEYEQVLQAIEDGVLQYITVELSHKNNAVDYNEWNIVIYGKEGTIWDGGEFVCTMQFPEGYPDQPPLFLMPKHFLHMNVYISGRVCVDVLNLPQDKGAYKPVTSCIQILSAVQSILYDPNPDSPTKQDLAKLFVQDKQKYEEKIKDYVKQFIK